MELTAENFYKALADNTRLRSLMLLVCEGELCVCELTYALNIIQPKISRHLAQLRETGIVSTRREGQWIYYQLNEALPAWANQALKATAKGVAEEAPFSQDRQTLKAMPDRPGASCCA
ncbi:Arsenical resistance operon repressor [hydrothermal vent metagenome]|uniref:Arsenical resistance operon repressor n=1 Tax=hydrothermal vent metagenome TaxID=652676 RepID=A0A3B0YXB1_9ZZZZ